MAVRKNTIPEISKAETRRFMSKVSVGNGCWLWTGSTSRTNQYGQFSIRRKSYGPHCVAWRIFRGPIPYGYLLRHSCDNPICVNPEHLQLGKDIDNKRDSIVRGRAKFNLGKRGRTIEPFEMQLIRSMYPQNNQFALAKRFNVDQSVISRIINRKRNYK